MPAFAPVESEVTGFGVAEPLGVEVEVGEPEVDEELKMLEDSELGFLI